MCKTYHPIEAFPKYAKALGEHKVYNICKEQTNKRRRERQYSKGKFDWKAKMYQQYRRALKRELVSPINLQEGNCP